MNETTREVKLVNAKSSEGQILYEDKCWLVQTDPLFYEKQALYIVSDKRIPSFNIELEEESENEETTINEEDQTSIKPENLSPTA